MLLDVIFLCPFVIVTSVKISYTKESFTNYGDPCMTDCINNVCITGMNYKTAICNPPSRPGLQYYTAQIKTKHNLCKSRCGKFGNTFHEWCYVTDDKWDYCNSEMGIKIVKHKAFTKTEGPCKDECDDRQTSMAWCHTYWTAWYYWGELWDYCNPEELFTYMHTKTHLGDDCVGICGAHQNKNYLWCVSTEELERSCAPVARNFTLFNDMFDQVRTLGQKDRCLIDPELQSKMEGFRKHNSVPSGFVSRQAKLLEHPNIGLFTENLNEDGNPITRYTIMPYAVLHDPTLPIVVRARVTPGTLRPLSSHKSANFPLSVKQNFQRMGLNVDIKGYRYDEDGHIISYILGGPGEVYNFAEQTQRLRIEHAIPSVWYETEILIHDFIFKTKGWAEITVVLVYSNIAHSWMPDGYAVNFELYNYDNTLYRECNDYYYSNNLENPII